MWTWTGWSTARSRERSPYIIEETQESRAPAVPAGPPPFLRVWTDAGKHRNAAPGGARFQDYGSGSYAHDHAGKRNKELQAGPTAAEGAEGEKIRDRRAGHQPDHQAGGVRLLRRQQRRGKEHPAGPDLREAEARQGRRVPGQAGPLQADPLEPEPGGHPLRPGAAGAQPHPQDDRRGEPLGGRPGGPPPL